ncbi:MAG TPA: hypothetical protein VGQ02_06820 [Candidatus Limnocylindrales bacterium]|jgi:hypothetical protein|nr:hypothetical protein [Candidatus Limnocylindrales bacterium]
MEISLVTEVPKPLFLLACGDVDSNLPRIGWLETLRSMCDLSSLSFEELVDSQYRSVTLGRLERVLSTGIDVEPPTAVFSTDSWDKALEYGGWPKLLLVLNQNLLAHSTVRVPADTPAERLEELRAVRPTLVPSLDGRWLCLSRLTDHRACDPYDIDFGRWIPGRPLDALRAAVVLSHPRHGGRSAVALELEPWLRVAARETRADD